MLYDSAVVNGESARQVLRSFFAGCTILPCSRVDRRQASSGGGMVYCWVAMPLLLF